MTTIMALPAIKKPKRKGKIFSVSSFLLLPSRMPAHSCDAGINPLVDAASRLFTTLGHIHHLKVQNNLEALQKELIKEIRQAVEYGASQGYDAEYLSLYQYILSVTLDDLIATTSWAAEGQWQEWRLQQHFKLTQQNNELFFVILEKTLNSAERYLDLMEVIYLCLSLGFEGPYRERKEQQFELMSIMDNLYKHIRSYRTHFSKTLSPSPLTIESPINHKKTLSLYFILFASTVIMILVFLGLSHLMDASSNEVYNTISLMEKIATQVDNRK